MVVVFFLWYTFDDSLQPVLVFGYIAHLALPVAFVWLPLAVWRRRWVTVAIEGICLVAFVWLFGADVFRSHSDPPPEGSMSITVMTYNLGNGLATPDKLIPALRSSGADVVGLQEVTQATEAALAAELTDLFPYRVLHALGIPGKGLLSRYPILRSELLELNPGRPDLRAVVDMQGTRVAVIVAHPPPPRLERTGIEQRPGTAAQVDGLVAAIAETDGPLLVLGDFNVTRLHDAYRRLEDAGLRDAYRLAGRGPGFTTPTRPAELAERGGRLGSLPLPPLLRIDYVWVSTHWQPVDAWIGPDAGSDHLPVLARIAISP